MHNRVRETGDRLVRMVKRDEIGRGKALAIRAAALLCAMAVGTLLIVALGHQPLAVYMEMLNGSLGSRTVLTETVKIALPLIFCGIAISIAFRMRFWNIGAEGQLLMGGIAATYVALFHYQHLPRPALLLVMALAALAAGALWGLIPAFFKARWGTNETLFTLMLNYIALGYIRYLQTGTWRDPRMRGFPKIASFDLSARLPNVLGVHVGWIVMLALVVLAYLYLTRTKSGFEISVVGQSQPTASYIGMNVSRIVMRTMAISGALAGLAGYFQVAGVNYTLTETTAGGIGFTAITVAWLAKLNPILIVPVAFFIAILEKGAGKIQTTFKIPASAADVLTGIILFFMLGCEFFLQYRLIFRAGRKETL